MEEHLVQLLNKLAETAATNAEGTSGEYPSSSSSSSSSPQQGGSELAQATKDVYQQVSHFAASQAGVLQAIGTVSSNDDTHLSSYKQWMAAYGALPNELTLGMSRLVDPSDAHDWARLGEEIFAENPAARMDNDAGSNVLVEEHATVYHMALSYRHEFTDVAARPEDKPRQTISWERWELFRIVCENQMKIRSKKKLRIWIDQILGGRKNSREGKKKEALHGDPWILNGLLPYVIFQVAFVPSPHGLFDDMERMWILVEQLLATHSLNGVATLSRALCREVKDQPRWEQVMGVADPSVLPKVWTSNRLVQVATSGMILAKGSKPLDALTELGRALLAGCLDSCPCFHRTDYELLLVWAARLASLHRTNPSAIARFCTEKGYPDPATTQFSYSEVNSMIDHVSELNPIGSVLGASPAIQARPAMLFKPKNNGAWDGVIEWLPGTESLIDQNEENNASWLRFTAKDSLEKSTQWVLCFHENDRVAVSIGRLENPMGGPAAYMCVLLKDGAKPFGQGSRVDCSQLGWPYVANHLVYEECFTVAFFAYRSRRQDKLSKAKNLGRLKSFWTITLQEWSWIEGEGIKPLEHVQSLDHFGAIRGPELRWGTNNDTPPLA